MYVDEADDEDEEYKDTLDADEIHFAFMPNQLRIFPMLLSIWQSSCYLCEDKGVRIDIITYVGQRE